MIFQIILSFLLFKLSIEAPAVDLVKSLPGLSQKLSFLHYSGYLHASNKIYLHYWFVESQNNPKKDPVVLWLNGGPGCSSMDGLLNEHGPFLLNDNGTLRLNKYSWNKFTNVLYLEAPAGVGYSYATDNDITTSDDLVSYNSFLALKNFFQKFPEYKSNDFYITGESYAGVYVPTLVDRVMRNSTFKLKGFAVGNGLSSYVINTNSLTYFAAFHGLIGDKLWTNLKNRCCQHKWNGKCMFSLQTDLYCQRLGRQVESLLNGLDVYNLYAPCYGGVNSDGNLYYTPKSKPQTSTRKMALMNLMGGTENVGMDIPCTDDRAITKFMNDPKVKAAIHVTNNHNKWSICNDYFQNPTHYVRIYTDMTNIYRRIMSYKPNLRILIYNGDIDMACNFLGDQWFFDNLNPTLTKPWHQWFFTSPDGTKQVAGWTKTSGRMTFITIRGAGHMVPQDKPSQGLEFYKRFIYNTAF